MSQQVTYLFCKHEKQSSDPRTHINVGDAHPSPCNTSTEKAERGDSPEQSGQIDQLNQLTLGSAERLYLKAGCGGNDWRLLVATSGFHTHKYICSHASACMCSSTHAGIHTYVHTYMHMQKNVKSGTFVFKPTEI